MACPPVSPKAFSEKITAASHVPRKLGAAGTRAKNEAMTTACVDSANERSTETARADSQNTVPSSIHTSRVRPSSAAPHGWMSRREARATGRTRAAKRSKWPRQRSRWYT
jgi:hypothetical protein